MNNQKIHPLDVMRWIAGQAPEGSRIIADVGNSALWGQLALKETKNPTKLLISWEFGSMGWAIGTAIGLALADPTKPVICITGDGSVLMNGQEMTVALEHNLPIAFIVLNDSSYGMVRHGQKFGGGADIANQLPTVDFTQLAKAYRISTIRLSEPDHLKCQLKCIHPRVYDILIDPEATPPIQKRIAELVSPHPIKNDLTTCTELQLSDEELTGVLHGLLDATSKAQCELEFTDSRSRKLLKTYVSEWRIIMNKIARHLG